MTVILRIAALFCICASFGLQAGVYKWVDENGRTHFSGRPPPSTQKQSVEVMRERTRASASSTRTEALPPASAFSNGLADYRQPVASETLRIRKLFEDEQFAQLNHLLAESLRAVETDIDKEMQLREVYRAFDQDVPSWALLFDRWIAQHPQQHQGYLARATYLVHRGWKARGGAFINETPKENLDRMTEFMNRAQSDLTRTLDLEASALWAYCLRIRIAKAGGNYPEALRALEQATARYPLTYLGRKYYLESLDPKWGGTPLSMISFANSAQQYVGSNPRLQRLVSYAHYEAGRMAYIRKEYSQALEYLSIAIDKGTQPRAYFVRGQTHARLGDHEKALADFNAVINRGSEDGDYYYWRARSFAGLKRFNEALMDIQRAHALKPDDEYINNLRVRLMGYVRTPDIASADEGSSGSEDAESLFRQARKLIEDNQPEQAKAILDRAIDLKPDEFRYYQLIDHALFKQGKLMDILGYWERYLSIKPNDHRAYLERAGTYYHLQDFDAAKLDAAKAVDLGSEKAKALYDRLQQVPRG